ncbi:MAG: 2-isopropylmalate synthase [Treponema sp.]|nr:2-isopropylmalate synthase [Treponema sp.]
MKQYKNKYQKFAAVSLPDRTWPGKVLNHAPVWCSVDLRDGNQALINPMGVEAKLEYFELLVKIGFKQIEVGYPSSSQTEFDFVRRLIEEGRIPDDVTIQVLTQAREQFVQKTVEAVRGAKNVILHLYNAISPAQRKYNFGKSKEEVIELAVSGVRAIKKAAAKLRAEGTHITLEYSPENFSEAEIDYSLQICRAVMKEWGASPDNKVILNLPATLECCMPNQFADLIEYFGREIGDRDSCLISLHHHNDRGEGIAQCEMGLLAGAERVEGCLFGNGERTGNMDVVTAALNLYTQGVDPELDFSDLDNVSFTFERLTGMAIHPRQPYSGELVYTAFSGGHQDAIRKAIDARAAMGEDVRWDVPYLLIDPHDIGREYTGLIRINSQSGKGGAVYVLEHEFGIMPPKEMHPVIGAVVKARADELQRELSADEIYSLFEAKWITTKYPLNVLEISEKHMEGERGGPGIEHVAATAAIEWLGKKYVITANGNGPLDAFVNIMKRTSAPSFNITSFHEHSIGSGSDTHAISYVQITKADGTSTWGVGKSSNVGRAGIAAIVSAINYSE